MKVYRFSKGGLQLKDAYAPGKDPSVIAFLPTLSIIPMIQHTGKAAEPLVSQGDQVQEGMLIGRGRGAGSANVHATVPGKILRIFPWIMGDGRETEALLIRLEGAFQKLGRREEKFPWNSLSHGDLIKLLNDKGVVEMEDEGRPVQELLRMGDWGDETRTLLVRCVFDDPWKVSDYMLAMERTTMVAEGVAIAAKAARCSKVLVVVTQRDRDMGEKLLAAIHGAGNDASLVMVGDRYPQSNRRELELVLRNYEKSEDSPLGFIIPLGPATLAAIHDAVKLNKPILERYVAVGGGAVKHPRVLRVRIGTRIGDVFAECGGFVDEPRRIVIGSPLKGRAVVNLDEPITKSSYTVIALTSGQINVAAERDCIGCGECRAVCPVSLDPEHLYKLFRMGRDDRAYADGASLCHGCGCCQAVCPSRLPLASSIQISNQRGSKG